MVEIFFKSYPYTTPVCNTNLHEGGKLLGSEKKRSFAWRVSNLHSYHKPTAAVTIYTPPAQFIKPGAFQAYKKEMN